MNNSFSATRAVVLLTVIAVAVRAGMLLVYQPVVQGDTGTYHTLAAQLLNLDFRDYKGLRTPGYPVLLLLVGENHYAMWLVQSVMGVLISLMLFWICLVHTGNAVWSLPAGLFHTLALNQLVFEANILSETFATLLVVLSIVCLVRAIKGGPQPLHGVAAGFVSSMTALTRTVYIYVGPLFVILVLLFERDARRLAAGLAVAFLLPVLGWVAFNKVTINYFGFSTMAGYNLTNHSGRFMEKAGDEYATIRDIYLKYRTLQVAETGSHSFTVFYARRELLEKTGLDEVALSRQLTRLSLELFAKYPLLYLRSVAESWASFWAAPNYMKPDMLTVPGAARVVEATWLWERRLVLMMNFLAILASGWVLVSATVRRLKGTMGLPIPLIVTSVIIAASVLQALVEFGENPRYGIPTQSLAALLVLLVAWDLRATIKSRFVAAKA